MQTTIKSTPTNHPISASEIDVLVGEAVFEVLSDKEFQKGWDILYQSCTWGTVFQSREFVSSWYRTYHQVYLPVLVRAGQGGQLTGLLTMAMALGNSTRTAEKGAHLLGAGHYEAEYQTWLAVEGSGEAFITTALAMLRKHFPKSPIVFRFLPQGTPINWIKHNPQWREECILQPFRRPLMEMSDPEFPKLFRKSEYKNKFNRLRRLGQVSLERITDEGEFSSILVELAIQYDFRQGALFNKNRFRENPLKAVFLQEMFRQGLLHVTVLRVEGEIKAAIAAVNGGDWVHLGGINVHTPLYANFYSPGFVHFLMLGQLLAQEGFSVFDLTPGGDSYKERMATKHDYVHELVVSNNLPFRLKKQFKQRFNNRLIKAGLRPMSIELSLRKRVYLLKARMKSIVTFRIGALIKHVKKSEELRNYKLLSLQGKQADSTIPVTVQCNNFGNILDYEVKGSFQTRWEFLEEAMKRFEAGEWSYTWSEEGRLLGCAWLGKGGAGGVVPAGAPVLQGFYYHPAGQGELAGFLAAVVRKAAGTQEDGPLYAAAGDPATCRALEAIGFKMLSQ